MIKESSLIQHINLSKKKMNLSQLPTY